MFHGHTTRTCSLAVVSILLAAAQVRADVNFSVVAMDGDTGVFGPGSSTFPAFEFWELDGLPGNLNLQRARPALGNDGRVVFHSVLRDTADYSAFHRSGIWQWDPSDSAPELELIMFNENLETLDGEPLPANTLGFNENLNGQGVPRAALVLDYAMPMPIENGGVVFFPGVTDAAEESPENDCDTFQRFQIGLGRFDPQSGVSGYGYAYGSGYWDSSPAKVTPSGWTLRYDRDCFGAGDDAQVRQLLSVQALDGGGQIRIVDESMPVPGAGSSQTFGLLTSDSRGAVKVADAAGGGVFVSFSADAGLADGAHRDSLWLAEVDAVTSAVTRTMVVAFGDPAPGPENPAGWAFGWDNVNSGDFVLIDDYGEHYTMNTSGEIAFEALTKADVSVVLDLGDLKEGIYLYDGVQIRTIAISGGAVGETGEHFANVSEYPAHNDLQVFGTPIIDSEGNIAFPATLSGGAFGIGEEDAICYYRQEDGQTYIIARDKLLPRIDCIGSEWNLPGTDSNILMNDTGTVVFRSYKNWYFVDLGSITDTKFFQSPDTYQLLNVAVSPFSPDDVPTVLDINGEEYEVKEIMSSVVDPSLNSSSGGALLLNSRGYVEGQPVGPDRVLGDFLFQLDLVGETSGLRGSIVHAQLVANGISLGQPADVDRNGFVDSSDLSIVQRAMNTSIADDMFGDAVIADVNMDGVVDMTDVAIVVAAVGDDYDCFNRVTVTPGGQQPINPFNGPMNPFDLGG
ncbi:MAG: hypothetical protein GXP29_03035 [Planctomycetes bacterium]|nr:hypothetical protein [Planctomycetota bacterium]